MADKDGEMYRTLVNTALLTAAYIILASSAVIPSGIPILSFQKLKSLLRPNNNQAVINNSEQPVLPPSPVYGHIKKIKDQDLRKNQPIILLITMESLGLTSDKKIDSWIQHSFQQNLNKLSKKFSYVKIKRAEKDYQLGGTLGAELRYLCNFRSSKNLNRFRINPTPERTPFECLPAILSRQGFYTHYIHNGSSSFYRRNQ